MTEPRLTKLILMLSSDQPGEVVNAARMIGRALKSDGQDFHDLAKRLDTVPALTAKRADEPQDWNALAEWCADAGKGLLSEREYEFVQDMAQKLIFQGEPTEKQAAWLRSIYARLKRAHR